MRSQLKWISIPVFDGKVHAYHSWRAAFDTCVDQSPCSAEYKMLHLRQSLLGDALKAIETLGFSRNGYVAAKNLLDRKYGGERRKLMVQREEFSNHDSSKDLVKLTELLENVVFNLKDQNRYSELRNGTFYIEVMKKLPESLLIDYQR